MKRLKMAHRIELYTAVTLLVLILPINESAYIGHAFTTMAALGQEALDHLEKEAHAALSPHTGSHSIGCLREPKPHERLNCSIIQNFISHMEEAVKMDGLENDTQLYNKLNGIRHRIEDLKESMCGNHTADVCDVPFQNREMTSENLENLRGMLQFFIKWFSKPME